MMAFVPWSRQTAFASVALVFGLAALFYCPPAALSEEKETVEPTSSVRNGETVFVEPVSPTSSIPGVALEQRSENPELISVALDNVPLEDVVRLFARISSANIIASSTNLQGTVTVTIREKAWKPALSAILDMHGLVLVEKTPGSDIYSIVPRPPGAPEPLLTETFFLRYAGVSNTVAVLRPLLPAGASVSPYGPANALVVRSTEANLSEIRKIIEKLDTPRQQVFIEAKFIELNDKAIKDLGVNWQILQGLGVSASGLRDNITETRTRSDLDSHGVLGMQDYRYVRSRDLDRDRVVPGTDVGSESSRRQLIESRIQGRNLTDMSYDNQNDTVSWELVPSYQLNRVRTAILSLQDVQLILSALKQTDGATVVSNPKIIVANEESAVIHIGETERPFISTVTPGREGTDPLVTYNPGEPVDLGVKVLVTPTINTENHITVRIEPELTRRLQDAVAPNGQTYPIIAKKRIQTIFSLENNKTAAIGGLTETTEKEVEKKIPLLGDIPFLGRYLFSHSSTEKAQKETIIFVTVGLANPEQIEPREGLPENARLVQPYLLREERAREQNAEQMRLLEEARQKEKEGTAGEGAREKKGFFRRLFDR